MNESKTQPIGSHDGREPIGASSAALALMTAALWGGTPVAISYSVDTLPPIGTAAIRFVLAALFMLVWCRIEGTELRLRTGQTKPALIAGLLLFVQIGLFHWGIAESNSSHASLFINTFVFWVAAIDHFVTKADRLSAWRLLGLMLAAAGVSLVLTKTGAVGDSGSAAIVSDPPTFKGDCILLASGFLLGIKIVYTKHALKTIEPSKLIFWHDVVGVVLFFAYCGLFEEMQTSDFNATAVWGLLYQGLIVAGLCFAVQTRLLGRHPASQLAVFSFTTPLFGIALGFLFRGDQLSPWLFVAGICVACGILMVNSAPRPVVQTADEVV